MKTRLASALAIVGWLAAVAPCGATGVPDWLTEPARLNGALAPDGARLAWSSGNRVHVAPSGRIGDSALHQAPGHVENLRWLGDLIVVHSSTRQRERLDLLDSAGKFRPIAAVEQAGRQRLGIIDIRADRLLFASDARREFEPDVYAVRIPGGHPVMVQRNLGWISNWRTDQRGDVRLAQRWRPSGSGIRYEWLLRRGSRWQPVRGFELGDDEERVLRVTDRGLLIARSGAGQSALQWFDPLTGRMAEPLWLGEARILGVVDAAEQGPPGLIAVEAERRELLPMGDYWTGRLNRLKARYPDHVPVLLGRGAGDRVLLWKLFSDRDPGRYVLQIESGEAQELFGQLPGLTVSDMHRVVPFDFDARDSLLLEGYITGVDDDAVRPGVVLVHGGPWTRDSWRFHAEAQFLAGLGYAVVQVNFRGSRGLGSELLAAGRREWGRRMQDDLVDAVHAASDAGWIDPERVCVMGASYGGYAALMAVLNAPEVFRCAISRAPVTDLPAFVGTIRRSGNRRGYLEWREMVGPDSRLRRVSPISRAGELERPVLVAHGLHDCVVPPEQGRRFAAASAKATWLPLESRHRLLDSGPRAEYYAAVAGFLGEHLPVGPGGSK